MKNSNYLNNKGEYIFTFALVLILMSACQPVGKTASDDQSSKTLPSQTPSAQSTPPTNNTNKTWSSQLYPKVNNSYKLAIVGGFKLRDYSYAGYHAGNIPIPKPAATRQVGPGAGDDTALLQKAINDAKGGVLLILPGTYAITNELVIPTQTIVRGSGTDKTFIVMDKDRDTSFYSIFVANRGPRTNPSQKSLSSSDGTNTSIVGSVPAGSTSVTLASAVGIAVGDMVVIKNTMSDELRFEYNEALYDGSQQIWPADNASFRYLRRVTAVNGTKITFDRPTVHLLQSRDKPHIVKITFLAEEIGIEDLSLGFRTPNDYPARLMNTPPPGTNSGASSSYHAARAITVGNVINGWIRNVKTFSPNKDGVHLHSRGISITGSRGITIENSYMGPTAHRGGGGNGYLYVLDHSSHVLIKNSVARGGRHNFIFGSGNTDNVITGCRVEEPYLTNDTHGSFSHGNLIDNMVVNSGVTSTGLVWQAHNRAGASGGAGVTGADNVFWNISITNSTKVIESAQSAVNGTKGYVIGATAVSDAVKTTATEWREGIGAGDGTNLAPQSLYETQRAIRLGLPLP